MGVILPPSSDGDDSNGNSSGSNNGKGKGGTSILIPNPSSLIPSNPSIGLRLWGPLVPASDNLIGLYLLTGLQIGIGLLSFNKVRMLRKSKLAQYNLPDTLSRRTTKVLCGLGGSYLIFQSGFEIARLSLPYDPWFDEAKFYRKLAIKNGETPSWWFGAYNYFKPMSFKDWNVKVEKWIDNVANATENSEESKENGKSLGLSSGRTYSPALAKLAEKGKYYEIHKSLHETNKLRYQELLNSDLKDVNDLNKADRLDRILEGIGEVRYNENYTKPHIQLGNHRMETDEEFEMIWLNFEPWEELKMETDYDIRLIPRWRWSNDDQSENKNNGVAAIVARETKNSDNIESTHSEAEESHI